MQAKHEAARQARIEQAKKKAQDAKDTVDRAAAKVAGLEGAAKGEDVIDSEEDIKKQEEDIKRQESALQAAKDNVEKLKADAAKADTTVEDAKKAADVKIAAMKERAAKADKAAAAEAAKQAELQSAVDALQREVDKQKADHSSASTKSIKKAKKLKDTEADLAQAEARLQQLRGYEYKKGKAPAHAPTKSGASARSAFVSLAVAATAVVTMY